jgi:hypothetical protein
MPTDPRADTGRVHSAVADLDRALASAPGRRPPAPHVLLVERRD